MWTLHKLRGEEGKGERDGEQTVSQSCSPADSDLSQPAVYIKFHSGNVGRVL